MYTIQQYDHSRPLCAVCNLLLVMEAECGKLIARY